MERSTASPSFAADLEKFVHVFYSVHFLEVGGDHMVEAGEL
jgi:hypothetical protein